MKIKPVLRSAKPKYPDKYEINLNQTLLYYRPQRWLNRPMVGVALTAMVSLGMASCTGTGSNDFVTGGTPMPIPTPTPTSTPTPTPVDFVTAGAPMPIPTPTPVVSVTMGEVPVSFDKVVPFFEHGNGTGSYGGYYSAAWEFMSEEEAFEIISSTLQEAGYTCKKGGDKLENATVPLTGHYPYSKESEEQIQSGTVEFDAKLVVDDKRSINIEFVSKQDFESWVDPNPEYASTVSEFNIKGAAEVLHVNNNTAAVFYDPAAFDESVMDTAREELRTQVLDFIEWLKSVDIM